MRRRWAAVLMLSGILLCGCQAASDAGVAEERPDLELLAPDAVSQDVYDAPREEWAAWGRLDDDGKMLSSRIPGHCRRCFDSWADCGEFLGFSIANPLEECSWLGQGTYAAMPLGFRGASRVRAGWYGTRDGHVEWIDVQAGYRGGPVRVTASAALYGGPAGTRPADSGWSVELERQSYLEGAAEEPLQTVSNRTAGFFSNTACQARGPVLYRFHIVGEPDMRKEVEETLERVLETFFQE